MVAVSAHHLHGAFAFLLATLLDLLPSTVWTDDDRDATVPLFLESAFAQMASVLDTLIGGQGDIDSLTNLTSGGTNKFSREWPAFSEWSTSRACSLKWGSTALL